MYRAFFGLNAPPFALDSNPDYLFQSASFRKVSSQIITGLGEGKSISILTGENGIGKTVLCSSVANTLRSQFSVVLIDDPQLSFSEIIDKICAEVGVNSQVEENDNAKTPVRCLSEHLLAAQWRGHRTILIIDKAEYLKPEIFHLLNRLDGRGANLLHFILVGRTQISWLGKFFDETMFTSRNGLQSELLPFTKDETVSYIRHRMGISGVMEPVFTRSAESLVHRHSGGVPKTINTICDHALRTACRRSVETVTDEIIQSVVSSQLPVKHKVTVWNRVLVSLTHGADLMAKAVSHGPINRLRSTFKSLPFSKFGDHRLVNQFIIKDLQEAKKSNTESGDFLALLDSNHSDSDNSDNNVLVAEAKYVPELPLAEEDDHESVNRSVNKPSDKASISESSDEMVEDVMPRKRKDFANVVSKHDREKVEIGEFTQGIEPRKIAAPIVEVQNPERLIAETKNSEVQIAETENPGVPILEIPKIDSPDGMVHIPDTDLVSNYDSEVSVFVPGFFIDLTPVTNKDYQRFVEETGQPAPEHWFGKVPPRDLLNHPVVSISWHDAHRFAQWCGKRLPSAFEWECCARRPDDRTYPWGNEWHSDYCNSRKSYHHKTSIVGSYPNGASVDGCLDLIGNVWEWTVAELDSSELENGYAWVFGGSYRHACSAEMGIARTAILQTNRYSYVGFRCVEDLP